MNILEHEVSKMALLMTILLFFISANVLIPVVLEAEQEGCLPHHPGDLKRLYKINWFGAILLYVLYFIFLFPAALVKLIIYLCTVGVNNPREK